MQTIINISSLLFFLSEFILLVIKRSKSKEVKLKKDKFSIIIIWVIITLSISSAIYFSELYPTNMNYFITKIVGIVIFILGIAIRWTSIIQLGKAFTVDVSISHDHKIKDDGLYKKVRHPSYTGLLLAFLGFSFLFNSWYPLLIINIPIFLAIAYRMKIEEEVLIGAFGNDYNEYMNCTKRILPGIY
jgi:protein-S-isoprenylcysteine O-methyltransferase Ste14